MRKKDVIEIQRLRGAKKVHRRGNNPKLFGKTPLFSLLKTVMLGAFPEMTF